MSQYLVHFVEPEINAFLCYADDVQHAISQAVNAYPDGTVYSVFQTILVYHVADVNVREFVRKVRRIVGSQFTETAVRDIKNLFEEYDALPGKMP